MRVVAIVQARTGSTRLPGKVLSDIGGVTMLERVVSRSRRSSLLDDVIVATSNEAADAAIAAECERLNTPVFRGSESDVLDRYYKAAAAFDADVVVRITCDCPLIDPAVIDHVVHSFLEEMPDYASNCLTRTYPRGLDTEVMSRGALTQAWREATERYQRVHVTPYLYESHGLFRILQVTAEDDHSSYRWTVDTSEDLALVRAVYERFGNQDCFNWRDVLVVLEKEPQLLELNRGLRHKSLQEG